MIPGRWLVAVSSLTLRVWVIALGFILAGEASACSVPVFRYALEHWVPAPYEAVVLHRDPLAPEAVRSVQLLQEAQANLVVRQMDAAVEEDLRKLWAKSDPPMSSPWLVLRREGSAGKVVIWSGPLTEASAAAVLDSPARREIVRHLSAGDSAVFVVLASGREAEDAALMRLMDAALPRLRELSLPKQAAEEASTRCTVPLKVAFSVLRVERGGAEDVFSRMLLQVEELETPAGPMVFPIFGRGRALAALPAADLDADVLRSTAAFLCGACSCEAKDLNPGADLLLAADWDRLLGLSDDDLPPPSPAAAAPAAPAAPAIQPPAAPSRPAWLYGCLVAAGALVLITGARALRWQRPVSKPSADPPNPLDKLTGS
jgi:hypothetical protein